MINLHEELYDLGYIAAEALSWDMTNDRKYRDEN